jgi:asparagine synthase (glutamine-hydrolysing)
VNIAIPNNTRPEPLELIASLNEDKFVAEPFVHIKRTSDRYEIEGQDSCFVGHTLPSARYERPDGIYAQWSWDGERLLVRNDRYGFHPLYYFTRENEIAVSTSLTKLITAGAPTELDEAGMAVFLRLGFFIGEATPFKAIRQVPPDCNFEWKDNHLAVTGQVPLAKLQHLKRDELIEAFATLFKEAMLRRLPVGPSAAPISGGRDSRHILLELCEASHPPDVCPTLRHFPPRNDTDAESATELTKALNVRHVVLTPPSSRLAAELKKNHQTNFATTEHAWLLPLAEHLNGNVETMYDGIGGDVLSAGHCQDSERLAFYEAGDFAGLARFLLSDPTNLLSEKALQSLVTPSMYRRFSYELALSHLTAEVQKHADAPNPVASFVLFNRTRRAIATSPYCLFDKVPNVFSPYLDHAVFDLLSSQPARMMLDYRLHTETIARTYPRYAGISYGEKKYALRHSAYHRNFAVEVLRYYLSCRPQSINASYVLPRLLRSAATGDDSIASLGVPAIYLSQLEGLVG